MTASPNLDRLDAMFPDVLLLTPEQTAQALGWNRKKIYRLIAAKTLPFPVRPVGNLLGIPKLALGQWLDDGMPEAEGEPAKAAETTAEPQKKKRGRPRKALSVVAFQAGLSAAFEHHTLAEAIKEAVAALKPKEDDKEARDVRDGLLNALGAVRASREEAALDEAVQEAAGTPNNKRGP